MLRAGARFPAYGAGARPRRREHHRRDDELLRVQPREGPETHRPEQRVQQPAGAGHVQHLPQQNETILYSYDRVLRMDVARQQVYVDNEPVYLLPREFHLLYLLLLHAGKVLTHRFLLQQVWGEGYSREKDYVRVCICQLRKKIVHNYILTQSKAGYLFRDRDAVRAIEKTIV